MREVVLPPAATTFAGNRTAPLEAVGSDAPTVDPADALAAVEPFAGATVGESAPVAIGAPMPGAGIIIGAAAGPDIAADPEPDVDTAPNAAPLAGVAALRPAVGGVDTIPGVGVPTLVGGGKARADPAFDPAEIP